MADPSAPAASEPPAPPITVQKEWITIAVFSGFVVLAEVLSYFYDPKEFEQGKRNVFSVAAGLLWWLGHALWLSMDRRRRGLEMGGWRYAVLFLGPFAIWLYLILEYRVRALIFIPLSLAIYIVIGTLIFAALALSAHLG